MRASTLQVAAKLAKLEVIADLCYRGVKIEADAVDVTPCHKTAAATSYRFFLVRPVGWPARRPHPRSAPTEWKSEVISIPREARAGLDAGLAGFETEFATYTFLQHVARAIDGVLLQVAECQPS
jgi:hypothetical protein